jgi:uncharacterized protein (TIGR01619 family)
MSDEWEFYFTGVNDKLASILVDVGIYEQVPDPERPWLLRVWVFFESVDEHGLPSGEEAEEFSVVEDTLTEAMSDALDAVLAGRMTIDGRREFFFYANSFAGFEDAVARCLSSYPKYEWDTETENDSEWNHYVGLLYPSPGDWQQIQNRQVIEQLVNNGDTLEKKRVVSHWAYFPNTAARDQFVVAVQQKGFEVTEQTTDDTPEQENPLGVGFERVDHVDWESINAVTLELFELAASLSGNYDGWETTVETSPD